MAEERGPDDTLGEALQLPRQPSRLQRDAGLWIVAVLSGMAAIYVAFTKGEAAVAHVIEADAAIFFSTAPKVAAGCLIAAFVTRLVPRSVIARWVGEGSGLAGLTIAVTAGFLVPGGPFTAYPLALGFLVAGADLGAVIAFVISWLVIGINRVIVWELAFFPTDFVMLRLLVCLPLPFIAGALARSKPLLRLSRKLSR